MDRSSKLIAFVAVIAALHCQGAESKRGDVSAVQATNPGVTVKVQSARVGRPSADLQKRFGSRYYGGAEATAGVNMQLLLTLEDATMLTPPRDPVTIDTFVDDTYQSLLGNVRDGYSSYGANQATVSDDGHQLLFSVAASRAPADEAGRVFVRGAVEARLVRGKSTVETAKLPLTISQEVMVGQFRTTLRSISDTGGRGVSLTLAVQGEINRIQKVRVLSSEGGDSLTEERLNRFTDNFDSNERERSTSIHIALKTTPKEPVVLEYTIAEKIEQVRIPFEAQVDFGVAKAGPLEASEGKKPKAGGAKRDQEWPPRRSSTEQTFPARRAAFDPGAAPKSQTAKQEKAAVDLFSLTVGKSAPNEQKNARWNNQPSPSFAPSGFTSARLLFSVPGKTILSVPPDGISVTRFEDDKGGKLSTKLYRDSFSSSSALRKSPDDQQMLLNVSLASSPTPGATRCTLVGMVKARVGHGQQTNATEKLDLHKGQLFRAGPFRGSFVEVRQPVGTENNRLESAQGVEVWIQLSGPVQKARSVEIVGADTGKILASRLLRGELQTGFNEEETYSVQLAGLPSEPVLLRVRHYESEGTVEVPFNISTGIGL